MTFLILPASEHTEPIRPSRSEILDNFVWRALSGPQAHFATGTRSVRKLARGFTPLMAAADPEHPDFDALAPYCQPGERLHCLDWSGSAPKGWRIEFQSVLSRMVWNAAMPGDDGSADLMQLDRSHLSQVLDLVHRAPPGPFGPSTPELGEYFGFFANGRLVAMAGERLRADAYHEISAVCTDPDHRGQGLARALVCKLVRRQMQRGETPMLHVRLENSLAHRLYERMGFREHCRTTVRIVSYSGEGPCH